MRVVLWTKQAQADLAAIRAFISQDSGRREGEGQSQETRRLFRRSVDRVRRSIARVDAQFIPPTERLAFSLRLPGEADLPDIWPDPMPVVVNTIRAYDNAGRLGENLPDLKLSTA